MLLYDEVNARLLLGTLMLSPQILNNEKYTIDSFDFQPIEFHLRLYQAIYYLAKHGAKSIEYVDIYNISKKYSNVIDLFEQNDLKDFINTIKKLSNIDNLDLYYNEVKKYSLLRKYKEYGINTDKFEQNVSKHKLSDIIDYYDGLLIKIKKSYWKNKDIQEVKAGDGFFEIKEQLKKDPLYGATSFSLYLNQAVRGWRKGQLTMYGCISGSGKTTIGLYNLALVCCPYLWDDKQQNFVLNKCYQHDGGLFIQYELNIQEELMPKLVASVSGVPAYHILNGKYETGEEARVDRAIKILQDSNIHLITMPTFTNDKIKQYIRDYKINHQIGYVVFDYVSQTSTVANDIAKKNGIATRSDQVLSDIVSNLKEIAIENNVAVLTFCQSKININNQEILDANYLVGSRAMQDKLDVGGIIVPLRREEKEICNMLIESHPEFKDLSPNRIIHLFKVRFGSEIQNLKIWINLDLSTGKVVDMFCTDPENKLYSLTKLHLVYQE